MEEILKKVKRAAENCDTLFDCKLVDRDVVRGIDLDAVGLNMVDRLGVDLIMASDKIPQVFLGGRNCYISKTPLHHYFTKRGEYYFYDFFTNGLDYNMPFINGTYLSRVKVDNDYSIIESNSPLDENEIAALQRAKANYERSAEQYLYSSN